MEPLNTAEGRRLGWLETMALIRAYEKRLI